MTEKNTDERDARGFWRPNALIKLPPIYKWPPQPIVVSKWLVGFPGYLWPLNAIVLLISVFTWMFLTPDIAQMKTIELGWVGMLLVRNLCLVAVFLHQKHHLKTGFSVSLRHKEKALSLWRSSS